MLTTNGQERVYRLECRDRDDEPWQSILEFRMAELETYYKIMKGMKPAIESFQVQIVPIFRRASTAMIRFEPRAVELASSV
jgi:hypothetical protein